MTRKVCFITGSRAEYGLMRKMMRGAINDPLLEFQLIVTGAHLSPDFGLTFQDIESDGFVIDRKIDVLTKSNSHVAISNSMGKAMIGFGAAFEALQPHIIVLLGDRFESFSAAAAALIAKIPVAHLHGGEKTEGAFDDAIRNAITKMSHLHFVAANEYEKRVIQLGENPSRVFNVGGLGVDVISSMSFLTRAQVEENLGLTFLEKNILVTFHPETLNVTDACQQMEVLLSVLSELSDTRLIFTSPNQDPGGLRLIEMIQDFVKKHNNARFFSSLGTKLYLSCLAQVDGVVGNSSSGLLEAPTLATGTINIGNRQRGRLLADSVIQCELETEAIRAAIVRLYSKQFQKSLSDIENPYGKGGAGERILKIIRDFPLDTIVQKTFYDLPSELP